MADTDLTTPATAAAELGITQSDARLKRLISVASSAIRRYLERPLLHYAAGHVEKVPGFGRPRLVLSRTPVLSVASVVLDGATFAASEYSIEDADAGFLWRSGGWPSTASVQGGLVQSDPAVGFERAGYVVTYTGGWVTPAQADTAGWGGPARSLPEELEQACIDTVTALYRSGGNDPSVSSESMGDYSVTYRDSHQAGVIPARAMPMLDMWRRVSG